MRTPGVALLAVAVAAWLPAGCNDEASAPAKPPPIRDEPPSDGAGPRVVLRVKYPPGRFRVVHRNHSTHTMTPEGTEQSAVLKKRKDTWQEMNVSPPGPDGVTTLVSRIKRSTYYRSRRPTDLDTDRPESLAGNPAGQLMKAMLDMPVEVRLNEALEIVDVKGVDEMMEVIRGISPEAGTFIGGLLEAAGKSSLPGGGQVQRYMPPKPVGVGAVWYAEFDTEVKDVAKWHTLAKCKLAQLSDADGTRLATIDFVGRERIEPLAVSVAGVDVEADETMVDCAGRIVMEVDTGLVLSYTAKETKTVPVRSSLTGKAAVGTSVVEREKSWTTTRVAKTATRNDRQ